MKKSLDQFLKAPRRPRKCETCRCSPEIVKAIREFAERRGSISWMHFHRAYLCGELGYGLTYGALQAHVKGCL